MAVIGASLKRETLSEEKEIRFPLTFCIQPASDGFITERDVFQGEKISRKGCPTSPTILSFFLISNVIRITFQFTRFLFSVEKKNIDTDTIPLENFYRLDF